MNDSIYIRNYLAVDPVNFKIADGHALKDENENFYQGIQSSEVLTRKTLTPKIIHTYGRPEWIWEDDCTRAKAIFKCAAAEFTCTDSRGKHEETVEATVTKTYSNGSPKYTVSLTFEDETYTDTKSFDNPLDGDYTDPITAASARANDNNLFSLPDGYVYKKASLLGVQKKDNVNSETGLTSMRFVAEISSEYLDADDYGFEIVKTSKDTTKAFSDANGFNIMQNLLDSGSKNIKTFTCKGTTNKVSGNPIYGDNDSTSTEYKYVTLAVNDIPDTQGIAVRFYVVKDGVKYYSTYTNSEDTFRACCASCSQLIKTASPDEA